MSVQGILKAVLYGRLFGTVETRNIFTYGATIASYTTYDETHDRAAVKDGINAICTALAPLTVIGMNFYQLEISQWNGETFVQPVVYPLQFEGDQDGDFASFQTSALAKFPTGIPKSYGRKFFAGVAELMTLHGGLTATALSYLATVVSACVLSRAHGGVDWYPGIVAKTSPFAPFVSGLAEQILSTIRRRKPGYGI